MNPFVPPPNSRKIEVKDANQVFTPDSFLTLISRYKFQNPVKYTRKEASFKKKFLELGGAEKDFKLKVVKSHEELEVEIKGLQEAIKSKEEIEAVNAELQKKTEILNEEIERLKKERVLASK